MKGWGFGGITKGFFDIEEGYEIGCELYKLERLLNWCRIARRLKGVDQKKSIVLQKSLNEAPNTVPMPVPLRQHVYM